MSYLSARFLHALEFSALAHQSQMRKNPGDVPYISHPMAVASILMKAEFSEDVVIAGLLHDVIEDTKYTENDVRTKFGDIITSIVLGVTEDKSLPWLKQKQSYVENLKKASVESKAVSAADLLANRMSLLMSFKEGRNPWEYFSKKPKEYAAQVLELDRQRIEIIKKQINHPFIRELEEVQQEVIRFTEAVNW